MALKSIFKKVLANTNLFLRVIYVFILKITEYWAILLTQLFTLYFNILLSFNLTPIVVLMLIFFINISKILTGRILFSNFRSFIVSNHFLTGLIGF